MLSGRFIRRFLLSLLVVLIVLAVGLYVLSSMTPSEYKPELNMTNEQREQAAWEIINTVGNLAGNIQRYSRSFELAERDANRYLASLDEIASQEQNIPPGTVDQLLENHSLGALAIAMKDGYVTLMVALEKHGKILSIDITAQVQDDEILLSLTGARLGRMYIPISQVLKILPKLGLVSGSQSQAEPELEDSEQSSDQNSEQDSNQDIAESSPSQILTSIFMSVLSGIEDQRFPREFLYSGTRILVDSISMEDGKLTVEFKPLAE